METPRKLCGKRILPTRMGFEPTRAEHIGLAVQRLNHSATSSLYVPLVTLQRELPSSCCLIARKRTTSLIHARTRMRFRCDARPSSSVFIQRNGSKLALMLFLLSLLECFAFALKSWNRSALSNIPRVVFFFFFSRFSGSAFVYGLDSFIFYTPFIPGIGP